MLNIWAIIFFYNLLIISGASPPSAFTVSFQNEPSIKLASIETNIDQCPKAFGNVNMKGVSSGLESNELSNDCDC